MAVLVVGVAVVWFGWWSDRRRNRARETELRESVPRSVPGADDARPTYTTESDLAGLEPPVDDLPATSAGGDSVELDGGLIDPAFVNSRDGRGFLSRPLVLVVDTHLDNDRLLLEPLSRAQRLDRGLVIVAPTYTEPVLSALRANVVTHRVQILPIATRETVMLRRAVALTGGLVVTRIDLQSGYLPEPAWGTCDVWQADASTSWITVTNDVATP